MTTTAFDTYFLNKPVLINWERIYHVARGDRIFKIVSHFKLYGEAYIIITGIDEHKEIMVKFNEIKAITIV